MVDFEEIEKLSPEERIRKLKELEEERKKELEKAKKMIAESEEEIHEEETKEDIREMHESEKALLEEMIDKEPEKNIDPALLNQYDQKIDQLKDELYAIEDRAESGSAGYTDMKRAYEIENQLKETATIYRSTSDAITSILHIGERVIDKVKDSYLPDIKRPEQ